MLTFKESFFLFQRLNVWNGLENYDVLERFLSVVGFYLNCIVKEYFWFASTYDHFQ